MANEKNLLDFPTTTSAESADWVHIQQGGVDKKISLADFIAELNGGNPFNITVREESGSNRILTIADKNAYIRCLNAVQTTIQVKNAQTVGWKKGDSIVFRKEGLGNVLMAADSGVTIRSAASGLSLTEVGQAGQLICVDDTPTATIFDFVTGGNGESVAGGQVDSVVAGAGIKVDSTDPDNPIVSSDFSSGDTDTAYTLSSTNDKQWMDVHGGANVNITCPPESSVDLGDKFVHVISVFETDTTVTFVAGAGVTVIAPAGGTLIATQNSTVGVKKASFAADTYIVFGPTEAA